MNQPNVRLPKNKVFRVYTALISQSGSGAPTVTVLQDNLDDTIVWSRDSTGIYFGTCVGLFKTGKVWMQIASPHTSQETGFNVIADYETENQVQILTRNNSGVYADSCLYLTPVEIRIYE